MQVGDACVVTNLDGETAEGEIVHVDDTPVEEHPAEFMEPEDATLFDYWRGTDVSCDDRVVTVELGTMQYEYPESRVEVVDRG